MRGITMPLGRLRFWHILLIDSDRDVVYLGDLARGKDAGVIDHISDTWQIAVNQAASTCLQ